MRCDFCWKQAPVVNVHDYGLKDIYYICEDCFELIKMLGCEPYSKEDFKERGLNE